MFRFSYSKKPLQLHRQRRHSGGSKIMFWGLVMPNGLVYLKNIKGIINSEKYIDILRNFGIPLMKLNMKPDFIFVQDNARPHVSRCTQEFLQTNRINALPWPAKSPDLNIMEVVWKMISDIVYRNNQPNNAMDLEKKVMAAVSEINNTKRETITELFGNQINRLTTVLVKQGNLCN